MMLALKVVCWLIVIGSVAGNWPPENYRSNSLIFIACLISLTAIYIAELVAK